MNEYMKIEFISLESNIRYSMTKSIYEALKISIKRERNVKNVCSQPPIQWIRNFFGKGRISIEQKIKEELFNCRDKLIDLKRGSSFSEKENFSIFQFNFNNHLFINLFWVN